MGASESIEGAGQPDAAALRVFACSDLHADWSENWDLLTSLFDENTSEFGKNDVLIIAGDISSDLDVVQAVLDLTSKVFGHVFYTNGNNELRIGRKEKFTDSLEKWHRVMQMASKYDNVHCSPKQIKGVWIVPLCSWYEPGLDPLYDNHIS